MNASVICLCNDWGKTYSPLLMSLYLLRIPRLLYLGEYYIKSFAFAKIEITLSNYFYTEKAKAQRASGRRVSDSAFVNYDDTPGSRHCGGAKAHINTHICANWLRHRLLRVLSRKVSNQITHLGTLAVPQSEQKTKSSQIILFIMLFCNHA